MAKTVTVNLADLKKLVEYCSEAEESHLEETEETEGRCPGHICYTIRRLGKAVEQAEKSGKPLVVKRVISEGELSIKPGTKQADIIRQAGDALDGSCSGEIVGDVCFQATNGKYYSVFVEAEIAEINKSLADDIAEMHGDAEENQE